MGACKNCCKQWRKRKTRETQPPTLPEVVSDLDNIKIASQADGFIAAIKEVLNTAQEHTQDTPSTSSDHTDKLSDWNSFIQSGGKFLDFFTDHTEKLKIDTTDSFFQSGMATEIIGGVLVNMGHLHWTVAGLSVVGYMVSKCAKMSENKKECLELLQEMVTLASHLKDLDILIIEENKETFQKAFEYIIEGSISCASQLGSNRICRFLKSSVNAKTLIEISTKINKFYKNEFMTVHKELLRGTTLNRSLLRTRPPYADVFDDQIKQVYNILDMENGASLAVAIRGLGGTGKSTLAEVIFSEVDKTRYNLARIVLDWVPEKNDYIEMQRQILRDAFPKYGGGRKTGLRNDKDGREYLTEAFKTAANKPVFIWIDNAIHIKDLERIFPENLGDLPQRSRILLTTETVVIKDVLKDRGLHCDEYLIDGLSYDHSLTILCKLSAFHGRDDIGRIVRICNGIPFVLKTIGFYLSNKNFEADHCRKILRALQTNGGSNNEDVRNNRLMDFVYRKREEDTEEAYLDICRYFQNYYKLGDSMQH